MMNRTAKTNPRVGFTLIEVMVVVLLMSLMAGAAVLSVRSHLSAARLTRTYEMLENIDRLARSYARRESRRYQLSFDSASKNISLRSLGDSSTRRNNREWRLPSGIEFIDFQGPKGRQYEQSFRVDFEPNGQSPSYAISVQASPTQSRSLVALGFSGQLIRREDPRDVATLLQ